jgi:hypothetical protein
MSSDYRIEKVRHRVDVTLGSGGRLEGDIFLPATGRFRAGPEEPLDVLNDDEAFLALVLLTGEPLLVQKSHIAVVVTGWLADDDTVDRGVVGMHVELALADGSARTGSIFPEVPVDRPRLGDFLNDTPLRFIALFANGQLQLVNRAHIVYARPVS